MDTEEEKKQGRKARSVLAVIGVAIAAIGVGGIWGWSWSLIAGGATMTFLAIGWQAFLMIRDKQL